MIDRDEVRDQIAHAMGWTTGHFGDVLDAVMALLGVSRPGQPTMTAPEPQRWEIFVPLVVRKPTGLYPLTMNDRLHWRPKAKLVAQIRESVAWHAKGMRIPPQEHVTVWLCYAPGSHRKLDAANLAATSKPAVDALQDAGIVPGDDARYVTERPVELVYDTGPRRAWLVVEASHITIQEAT